MSSRSIILPALFLLLSFGCSNTRFLTDEQVLYTGQEKVNLVQENEDVKRSSIRSEVQLISTIKPNNSIFDRRVLPPIGLWVYNYWEVDEEKKVRRWMLNRLSKPPVLISDINPALRAQSYRMIYLTRVILRPGHGRWSSPIKIILKKQGLNISSTLPLPTTMPK